MQYIFERKNEDGSITEEKVELERWGWGVIYKDGTELHQFGADGKFHQFKEVRQEDVALFTMYKTDSPTIDKRIDVSCQDCQFFHFYRNFLLENATVKVKIYVFGYKKNGTYSYNYIMPDDRLLTSDVDILDLTKFKIV